MRFVPLGLLLLALTAVSCKKDKTVTPAAPNLVFKFRFDSTQQRLNNFGQAATLPSGHAAQSPVFNTMSAHYVELAPNMYTALGSGDVLYKATEVTTGGASAIDFSQAKLAHDGETFFSMPIKNVTPGSYEWLRVSLAYQNYDIKYKQGSYYGTGTVASFIGFDTYIGNYTIKTQSIGVNANKLQGYWGFETTVLGTPYTATGQAPAGATTVPNPISATSPIPSGSCVVTGEFAQPLQITGNETKDMVVTVNVSTNKSFEWIDNTPDGYYEPSAGDAVVDMGVRGIVPTVQ